MPTTASGDGDAVEVKVTVAQLPTTKAIDNMIQNGQVQTSVNGLTIQNGLTTNLVSAKTATGKKLKWITDNVTITLWTKIGYCDCIAFQFSAWTQGGLITL